MKRGYDTSESIVTGCVIIFVLMFAFVVWGMIQIVGSLGMIR